jgi:hypothetical protein
MKISAEEARVDIELERKRIAKKEAIKQGENFTINRETKVYTDIITY